MLASIVPLPRALTTNDNYLVYLFDLLNLRNFGPVILREAEAPLGELSILG
jgi:hypothetical protein